MAPNVINFDRTRRTLDVRRPMAGYRVGTVATGRLIPRGARTGRREDGDFGAFRPFESLVPEDWIRLVGGGVSDFDVHTMDSPVKPDETGAGAAGAVASANVGASGGAGGDCKPEFASDARS